MANPDEERGGDRHGDEPRDEETGPGYRGTSWSSEYGSGHGSRGYQGSWGPEGYQGGMGGQRRGGESYASGLGGRRCTQGPYQGVGPRNYQRSDERIREEVSDRLMEHGELDASNLEVDVKNGEVMLKGTVSRRPMKRLAEDLAENVSGVKEIVNQLRVDAQYEGTQQLDRPAQPWGQRESKQPPKTQ
ncbi:MAG TPA: BON domain-containing protein [Candidatus Polarisedimenticolaceae bacterium]|nr:BON domain-containing protein [Candidatus Polarisedimenticolaceae bacterium]